jgi:hypothetical protein
VSTTKPAPDVEAETKTDPAVAQGSLATLLSGTKELWRAALIDVISRALGALALLGVAAIGALIVSGSQVPAWIAASIVIAAAFLLFGARRRIRRLRRAIGQREEHIAALEPDAKARPELEARISECEWRLRRHAVYGEHIAQMMIHLQQVIAGTMPGVTLEQFLIRGVLQPACDLMRGRARGEVRLAILRPDGDELTMPWAAGHNLQGQVNYRVPIDGSLTGLVLKNGVPQRWDDVREEAPFEPQPGATGPFQSLVSQPIRSGRGTEAVFNVTSTKAFAFDRAEFVYIMSLGSTIDLVVELLLKDEPHP